MSEIVVLLANPEAGGGLPHQWWPRLQAALAERALPFHVESESEPARLTQRARAWASEPIRALLALGGDDTVRAVADGLLDAVLAGSGYLPFGIVPLGRQNDIAAQWGLPTDDPVAALQRAMAARPRPMDVGLARINGEEHRFHCGITMGLATQLFQGGALPPARGRAPLSSEISLTVGGQTRRTAIAWVAVGNGPVQGGRFQLTPSAQPDDGWLALSLARALSAAEASSLLRRAESGLHVQSPLVSVEQVRAFSLTSSQPLPVALDGRLLPRPSDALEVEVMQGHLAALA